MYTAKIIIIIRIVERKNYLEYNYIYVYRT